MRSVITVIGKDTVGIIAKISAICSSKNANIVDINQSVMSDDIFVMVMLVEISDINCSVKDFSESFKETQKELGVDIRVIHEEVFNSMHRI